ncbi:uncharacterized protein LOC130966857 [Arachis stenosperma]|uniref:uncharacterized protein LOC130966857 n=1 Tax=Arachis stenosperma TaxID=217475 RepID=UPI0025ACA332|nr:uncharacterized protein LOC130966857 [Arachis stenosperma]
MQELRHRVQNLKWELASRKRYQPALSQHRSWSPLRRETRGRSFRRDHSKDTPIPGSDPESQGKSREAPRRWQNPIIYTRPSARHIEEENREDSREIMGATPFHHSILKVQLPKHFDKPTDMRYDGIQDPQEYLTAFEARMNLEGVGDEVRCRAIPVTLARTAIRWFNALLQGSVTTFADITRAFLAQFIMRIAKAKNPINLLGLTQRSEKPTRKYLDRFNDECLEIDGLTDLVEAPYHQACVNDAKIQNVAREYINEEEVSQVVAANKRQPTYKPARQPSNGERPKDHSKDGGPAKAFKPFPQVGKFTNYTPLTAPIVEVDQQIADKGILSKPRQLKDRTGGNKNLYCDYHKGFGHKTPNCFELKDAL